MRIFDFFRKEKIAVASFFRLFTLIMISLLISGSLYILSSFLKYQEYISEQRYVSESRYVINALKFSLNGLANSMVATAKTYKGSVEFKKNLKEKAFSPLSAIEKSNPKIEDIDGLDEIEYLFSQNNILSSIYILDSKQKVTRVVGASLKKQIKAFTENEELRIVLQSYLESDDLDNIKGRLFVISDARILPLENDNAIVLVYPILGEEKVENKTKRSEQQTQKTEEIITNKPKKFIRGYIVGIVPYETLPLAVRFDAVNSSIGELKTQYVLKVNDLVKNDKNKYLYINSETIEFNNRNFSNTVPISIAMGYFDDFVLKSFLAQIVMGALAFCLASIVVYVFGMNLSISTIRKIYTIISNLNISNKSYKFTPTILADIHSADKLLYSIWEQNRGMIEQLDNKNEILLKQGHSLLELKQQLLNDNVELEKKVADKTAELEEIVREQESTLTIYKSIINLSDYMDKQQRNAEQISSMLIDGVLTNFDFVPVYGFRISLSDEDSYEFYSNNLRCDFNLSRDNVDYNRKYYYLNYPDKQCRIVVFPLHSNTGVCNAIFFELNIDQELSSLLVNEITFVTKVIASHIDNTILRKKVETMAMYDELTGLRNRNCFEFDKAEMITAASLNPFDQRVGVFAIDLNGLKVANDTYGHQTGDFLISTCSKVLEECIADFPEARIYRIGGDEFVIVLIDYQDNIVLTLQENFQKAMSEKYEFNNRKFDVLFSYGFAETSHCSERSINQIFIDADNKLYEYKRAFYSNKNHSRRRSDSRVEERRVTDSYNDATSNQ